MVEGIGVNVNPDVKQRKTGGSSKAAASCLLPGLGQLCDGRTAAGLGYMGSVATTGVTSVALSNSFTKDLFEASEASMKNGVFDISKYMSKIPKGKLYGAIALGLATAGLWIANIVDAYKGNKNKA